MDGVFDLSTIEAWTPEPTWRIISAYDSYTWNLRHGSNAMEAYPLAVGTYTLEGYVVGYGRSAPVEFEVIPEPSTILLIVIGFVAVRARHHRPSLR